jgi:hypothetical protein
MSLLLPIILFSIDSEAPETERVVDGCQVVAGGAFASSIDSD